MIIIHVVSQLQNLTYTHCYLKSQAMGLPKSLTEMQMKFAQELISNEGRKTKQIVQWTLAIQKIMPDLQLVN